ncbi:urea amidolyase associated protein UAAP1 [Tepidicaulis sp. LMO-SS28]|uniref:urea amidolyase associated protein UAAP1 n=1 Tax=Tepidicaulis sp. LMO-SS28 TaxID=3447455 RepID=UPI003EE400F6
MSTLDAAAQKAAGEEAVYAKLKETGAARAARLFTADDTRLSNPRDLPAERILWQDTLPGGGKTSRVLRYGQTLRVFDPKGNASVALYALNADCPTERLNTPDTAKIQWNAFIGKGQLLYSDMGRVLLSLTEDTSGYHDLITGCSTAATVREKYGFGYTRNSRDNLLIELGKWGFGRRDLTGVVNLFTGVDVEEGGGLSWNGGAAKPGAFVDLRAEMNTLIVLSNCPHPLDPAETFDPPPVELTVWQNDAPAADDLCRTASIEAKRAFVNTQDFLVQTGTLARPDIAGL